MSSTSEIVEISSPMGAWSHIKTVVILVQENRSFDHMLGWMKSINPEIDGVDGRQSNPVSTTDPNSEHVRFGDKAEDTYSDPRQYIEDVYEQIYGVPFVAGVTPITPPNVMTPPMNGFVQEAGKERKDRVKAVMNGFRPDAVPVYKRLVEEFAVCDRWFASVPASAASNRLFVHSATSNGIVSNDWKLFVDGQPQKTIFDSLHESGHSFGIYYQYTPSILLYGYLWQQKYVDNFHLFHLEFKLHCRDGKLPNYVVVEPSPYDVFEGQKFVNEVYEALRSSPQWNEMLFVITYDEHGGFYDHVPTPVGVPSPDDILSPEPFFFRFDRLGVRVPTFFISPWIERGTVVHRPTGPEPTPEFEHSSIPATVKKIFNLKEFLTKRDAWAGTFESVLTRTTPRTDCPITLIGDHAKKKFLQQRPEKDAIPQQRPEEDDAILQQRPEKDAILQQRPEKDDTPQQRPEEDDAILQQRPEKDAILQQRPEKDAIPQQRPEEDDAILQQRPEKDAIPQQRPEKDALSARTWNWIWKFFTRLYPSTSTAGQGPAWSHIKTVVILVQENRSFDHMLGWMKSINPEIDGADSTQFNPVSTTDPNAERVHFGDKPEYVVPDLGHSIQAIYEQIYGVPFVAGATPITPPDVKKPPMNGFVQEAGREENVVARTVMNGFSPEAVPVYKSLVEEFAVCDRWFASVPASTQPNRLFVHSATSHGLVNNNTWALVEGMPQKTIFDSLHEEGHSFGIYYQYPPSVLFYRNLRQLKYLDNFHQFDLKFKDHCRKGKLPNYVVVEQRYFDLIFLPGNDDHPSHDVSEGQKFVKEVYEALRSSPQWNEMLFVITYDEHGGFYDHVSTPVDVPSPDDIVSPDDFSFRFDRLGVRVPTFFISPWIERGTVVHRPTGPQLTSEFEHSSIPATVKKIFNLEKFLTKRDEWAGTFETVLTRTTPRTDCPVTLPTVEKIRLAVANEEADLSEFQMELVQLGAALIGDYRKFYKSRGVPGNNMLDMTVRDGAEYVNEAFETFLKESKRSMKMKMKMKKMKNFTQKLLTYCCRFQRSH